MFSAALQTCMCVCMCDRPGNIEEWKANTVFNEDGKVFDIKHRFAEEDVDRERAVRITIEYFNERNNTWCRSISVCTSVCKSYTLTLSFSAGHHPSISHLPFVSLKDLRQTPVITPGVREEREENCSKSEILGHLKGDNHHC